MNLPLQMPGDEKSAPIIIEAMVPQDANRVADMFRAVVEELPYYNKIAKDSEIAKHTATELRQAITLDTTSVLVARAGRVPIGFCISKDDDGATWLDWFGMRADFRGLGVGRMLLDALERRALERGSHKIWCDSRTTNEASAKILTRQGYRPICSIEDHWYRQDFILWEKFVG